MRLNQITIPARDVEVSANFYRRLGFVQIVQSPHYARFICPEGDSTFSLYLTEEEFHNPSVIYFEHDELDQHVEKLESRGFEFLERPKDQTWLWREAILLDPAGNKVKLYFAGENRLNPPWRVEISN